MFRDMLPDPLRGYPDPLKNYPDPLKLKNYGNLREAPSVKPENIVRPFQSWQERYDQRIAELRLPPGEVEEDPELCIGDGDSGFIGIPRDDKVPGGGGFTVKDPEDDEEPEDPPQFTWTEQSRKTKKIRVENPDDSEQYVIVERIEEMMMTAPDHEPFNGQTHRWVFKNR